MGDPATRDTVRRPLLARVPRVWVIAGGGWAGRLVQVASQLAAVRIMTDELGTATYSVFAVLASLANWFVLSDFSIGISLQNHISERRVAEESADDLILTAIVLALGFASATALILFVVGPFLSRLLLSEFGFLTVQQRTLAFWAMTYPAIGTALGSLAYKIWFAQHRGYLSNLLPAIGTVTGTLLVWAVARAHPAPHLSLVTFLYFLPAALVPLIALTTITNRVRQRHSFRIRLVRPLLSRAGRFWVFGILGAAVLQVDYIIMAQTLGSSDIVVYNIASKVFSLILFVYTALLMALWPVCAEAIASHQWPSVMKIVRRYILLGVAFTLVAGLGFALMQGWVLMVLAPSTVLHIPLLVIVLLTLYNIVRVWTDTFGMVLQSMNDLDIFWIAVPFQSVLSICLQILGARFFGLSGMIGGLVLCFVLTVAWMLPRRCMVHANAVKPS